MPRPPEFPGFDACMKMMRHHDPKVQEDGLHLLNGSAGEFVGELISELDACGDVGITCWLMQLLSSTGDDRVIPHLVARLSHPNERVRDAAREWLRRMDSRSARIALGSSITRRVDSRIQRHVGAMLAHMPRRMPLSSMPRLSGRRGANALVGRSRCGSA